MKSEFEKWLGDVWLSDAEWDESKNTYSDSRIHCMWSAWQHQQSKIDELQRRNQMLNDNIKEQGQKLVYQNKVIETQAEKLLGLRDEKAELQKQVDAVKTLIEDYRDPPTEDKTFQHALSIVADELEQALKAGSTPNLNTDENGECRHFSTTMFADGKAECFQCDAVVNEQREVIGKQSKDLHPFFKREPK